MQVFISTNMLYPKEGGDRVKGGSGTGGEAEQEATKQGGGGTGGSETGTEESS